MNDTPKRGWLTFSIRDLFWLMVVVALIVGSWAGARRSEELLDRTMRELEFEKRKYAEEERARERHWQNQKAKVLVGQH